MDTSFNNSLTAQKKEEKQALSLGPFLHAVSRFVLGSVHQVQYRIVEAGALWQAHFHCNLLLRIFANIFTNAVEAMPAGGKITITIENFHAHGEQSLSLDGKFYLKVAIQDQGTGIPAGILPRIFSPGFSTKECGSGLGLAFCRSILEDNGGRLEATSTEGVGSVFTLYLPAGTPTD